MYSSRILRFEYLRSTLMASAASWNFRAKVCSGESISTFFTSCCVSVEPPCSISPAMRLVIAARIREGKFRAPWS